ncbi:hypothetical protein KC19_2G220600 [Ceratodon purpureus]|uniref:Uncharacterized protein n=1 Tax=Ceratodon purpureus TaxID=3225 RepID=A0A8T0IWQ6_CERPU|nr:hypothetical protein KC19_2G220600 [Ceratodon purpureus]
MAGAVELGSDLFESLSRVEVNFGFLVWLGQRSDRLSD